MLTLFLICISVNLSGIFLGNLFTENKYVALTQFSKKFNRKPFNCKPCLTFHLLWILYTIVAVIISSWLVWAIGLIFSFAIFGVLYLDNKSKIIK